MSDESTSKLALQRLKDRADQLRIDGRVSDDQWMLDLHRDFTQRFIADNNRIWLTGSLFIGISFGAVVLAPESIITNSLAGWASALASVSILVIWNLVAERHKEFQDRSFDVMQAIEGHFFGDSIIIDTAKRKKYLLPPKNNTVLEKLTRAKSLRWLLVPILILVWTLRLISTPDIIASEPTRELLNLDETHRIRESNTQIPTDSEDSNPEAPDDDASQGVIENTGVMNPENTIPN